MRRLVTQPRTTQHRVAAFALAAAACTLGLTACNADTTSAAPSTTTQTTSVVTVTTTVAAPAPGVGEGDTGSPTTGSDAGGSGGQGGGTTVHTGGQTTAPPVTPGKDVNASAFVGEWLRHASHLDINGDRTGELAIGSGAVDVETWSLTWVPLGRGIVLTMGNQISKTGAGVGDITSGQTVTAHLSTGAHDGATLVTNGLGDTGGPLTWCSEASAGTPECGA
ncbi:hypothetical protein ACWDTD_11625 [Gordonia sp. NPDC003425]